MVTSLSILPCRSRLDQLWSETSTETRQRYFLLGSLAAATTLNDEQALKHWLLRCQGVLELETIEELILQTLLFAGYPKTIEALKQVRKIYPQSTASKQLAAPDQAGQNTSRIIYRTYHKKLVGAMNALHPDLTRWMIVQGYGQVLSRPGLSLPERELGVVASLMASGMVHQYRAHVRGAQYAGIARDDILWFTNAFNCILAADLRPAFRAATERALEEASL